MLHVGIIGSNAFRIAKTTKKGTEIFLHAFLSGLAMHPDAQTQLTVTVFASQDSIVPFPLVHIDQAATWGKTGYSADEHKIYELALISKAFSMQDKIDLYHVNIGNGEWFLPFVPFIKRPIVITRHGTGANAIWDPYFRMFMHRKNIHFIAISESQRRNMPYLPYARTIHHGVHLSNFPFHDSGGEFTMWAGRAVPEKGVDTVLEVVSATRRRAKVFPILKSQYMEWFENRVLRIKDELSPDIQIDMNINLSRHQLVYHYQSSKLFLFPTRWEEPFGLVTIEAMACGTPVVAYARGAMPEIIVDGVTGYLVNTGESDIRGNFITKQTGILGLIEATERLHSLTPSEYKTMRLSCRAHVEKHFSMTKMVSEYLNVYKQLVPTVSA